MERLLFAATNLDAARAPNKEGGNACEEKDGKDR